LGDSKVSQFAQSLNLDQSTASDGLASMLPELIDSNSKGGSLLESAGGDLLGSVAKGALGKLFS